LVFLGILAGEDGELGFQAVLEGIEPGAGLALREPGPSALLAILATDGGALGRGERHDGVPPMWVNVVDGGLRRGVESRPGTAASAGAPFPKRIFRPGSPVA
jgi:hypothetical protein